MSGPGSPERDRVLRIAQRLVERTNADELAWERAALPESWAVNVGSTRFRVHVERGEQPVYTLELMGPLGETVVGDNADTVALLEQLYQAASANGLRHAPDPLAEVEDALGLRDAESAPPSTSTPGISTSRSVDSR